MLRYCLRYEDVRAVFITNWRYIFVTTDEKVTSKRRHIVRLGYGGLPKRTEHHCMIAGEGWRRHSEFVNRTMEYVIPELAGD